MIVGLAIRKSDCTIRKVTVKFENVIVAFNKNELMIMNKSKCIRVVDA